MRVGRAPAVKSERLSYAVEHGTREKRSWRKRFAGVVIVHSCRYLEAGELRARATETARLAGGWRAESHF